MKDSKEKEIKIAREDYPGAAADTSDKKKVTKKEVDCDVKRLNNNPRNDQ